MKVALALRYRGWMFALFPATLGLGTMALWLRSRNWPLTIDESGVRFRSHRFVNWGSVTKIIVSRSYLDGHVSQILIYHSGAVVRVAVSGLYDGQSVVHAMLFMFKRINVGADLNESVNGIVLPRSAVEYSRPFAVADYNASSEFESKASELQSSKWDALRKVLLDRRKGSSRVNKQEQA